MYGHLGASHMRKDAAAVAMHDATDGLWGWAFMALAAIHVPKVDKRVPGIKAKYKAAIHDTAEGGWGLKKAVQVAKNMVKLAYTSGLMESLHPTVQKLCGVGPSDVVVQDAPDQPVSKKRTRAVGKGSKTKEDKEEDNDEGDLEEEDDAKQPPLKVPKEPTSKEVRYLPCEQTAAGKDAGGQDATAKDSAVAKTTPSSASRLATNATPGGSPGVHIRVCISG